MCAGMALDMRTNCAQAVIKRVEKDIIFPKTPVFFEYTTDKKGMHFESDLLLAFYRKYSLTVAIRAQIRSLNTIKEANEGTNKKSTKKTRN